MVEIINSVDDLYHLSLIDQAAFFMLKKQNLQINQTIRLQQKITR